jgi:hypothetical protein
MEYFDSQGQATIEAHFGEQVKEASGTEIGRC